MATGENSVKTQKACTSTGSILAQGQLQPVLQAEERYPKMNLEKKTMGRNYPFSQHDNRATLQNNIETYDNGVGRKKCLDDRRQHNSHFCLCHDGSVSAVGLTRRDHSAYQSDFVPRQGTESEEGTHRRRFPRSHLERSHQAAIAGEHYMWFDLDHHIPLNVLADSNHSSSL
ncbi:testis-expressed protein 36 [Salminus brasiliensis]|uniref:testis-expressed protein 36 n=1 Tax=Salminus brasiliensis TaxID=930266 RepID=UPI003B83811C